MQNSTALYPGHLWCFIQGSPQKFLVQRRCHTGGTDGRSLVTLTHSKAANIENEYSGTELAV